MSAFLFCIGPIGFASQSNPGYSVAGYVRLFWRIYWRCHNCYSCQELERLNTRQEERIDELEKELENTATQLMRVIPHGIGIMCVAHHCEAVVSRLIETQNDLNVANGCDCHDCKDYFAEDELEPCELCSDPLCEQCRTTHDCFHQDEDG